MWLLSLAFEYLPCEQRVRDARETCQMCNQRSRNVPGTCCNVSAHTRLIRWPAKKNLCMFKIFSQPSVWERVRAGYNVRQTCETFTKRERTVHRPCRECGNVWQNFITRWAHVNAIRLGVTAAKWYTYCLFTLKCSWWVSPDVYGRDHFYWDYPIVSCRSIYFYISQS